LMKRTLPTLTSRGWIGFITAPPEIAEPRPWRDGFPS
jgi:hypothetical protein